jgi:crossover junction endodeoxyribonuclease RuvC
MCTSTKDPAPLSAGRALSSFGLAAEQSQDNRTAPEAQKNLVGIDPGIGGALALVSRDGHLVEIADRLTMSDGSSGRASVNAPLLAELLARWHAREVICEFVSARPKEGAVGAFSFGRSRGFIEGACAAFGLSIRFITSLSWKRFVGLPAGLEGAKDAARSAIRRWPDKAGLFARVRDDGWAEAALIAVAGLSREGPR